MVPRAPALITQAADLRRLAEILGRDPILAVDTESNSLYAYREQVCMIQFSTPRADYLVDPIVLKDLSPLIPLFSNPKIEKVFHAAEYDLLCLRRDFGFTFSNLFDTMVAARILGREAVGLGSMLEAEFGIQLDKHCQRANWGQRPLTARLLEYARLDTHYLIALRNRLRVELEERGLWPLAKEDFERMGNMKAIEGDGRVPPEDKTIDCWRISGAYDLKPQQAAVLLELCRYRDRIARSVNWPLFKVMGDQTLLAIAEQTPHSLEELAEVPGMSPGQVRRHGAHLLEAVQRGLKAEPIYPTRSPRPGEAFMERLEGLRRWRKAAALEMKVASDIVLPRDLVFSLAEQNPPHMEALSNVMSDVPWRFEHFGAQILETISAKKNNNRGDAEHAEKS